MRHSFYSDIINDDKLDFRSAMNCLEMMPFPAYEDSDDGYERAREDIEALMEFDLGLASSESDRELLLSLRADIANRLKDERGWEM